LKTAGVALGGSALIALPERAIALGAAENNFAYEVRAFGALFSACRKVRKCEPVFRRACRARCQQNQALPWSVGGTTRSYALGERFWDCGFAKASHVCLPAWQAPFVNQALLWLQAACQLFAVFHLLSALLLPSIQIESRPAGLVMAVTDFW